MTLAYHGAPDLCAACHRPFTRDEWETRHTGPDGSDLHAECCDPCPMECDGQMDMFEEQT